MRIQSSLDVSVSNFRLKSAGRLIDLSLFSHQTWHIAELRIYLIFRAQNSQTPNTHIPDKNKQQKFNAITVKLGYNDHGYNEFTLSPMTRYKVIFHGYN